MTETEAASLTKQDDAGSTMDTCAFVAAVKAAWLSASCLVQNIGLQIRPDTLRQMQRLKIDATDQKLSSTSVKLCVLG